MNTKDFNNMLDTKGYLIKKARLAADLKRLDLLPEIERELVDVNQKLALYLKEERESKKKQKNKKVNRTKNSNPITSGRPANRKDEQTPNATLFIV